MRVLFSFIAMVSSTKKCALFSLSEDKLRNINNVFSLTKSDLEDNSSKKSERIPILSTKYIYQKF